jgi:hypothetical protein
MSTNPPSFRTGFDSQIADMPAHHQQVIHTIFNALTDLYGAIPSLKSQITSNKTAIAAAAASINTSTSSETVIISTSNIGTVNNQTGVTSYTTLPSDYGTFIIFDDASPVAVTLSGLGSGSGISLPWYASFLNFGAGTVTLTPSSGTITYATTLGATSMPVAQGNSAIVVYDGTNYWAIIIYSTGGGTSPTDFTQIFMLMGA